MVGSVEKVVHRVIHNPTRLERLLTFGERVWSILVETLEAPILAAADWIDPSLCVWAIICVVGIFLIVGIVKRSRYWLLQRAYTARGMIVSCEALIEGSSFVMGEAPSYVAMVEKPGLIFSDEYVGLCVRVGDWITMPQHVFRQAGGSEGIILRRAGREPTLVRAAAQHSKVINDVVYLRLPLGVLSLIGLTKAPKAARVSSRVVSSVWGPKGYSTGPLYPALQDGILHYEGSTEPGYSGAAYTHNGSWVGMHLGSVTSKPINVAASAWLLEMESGFLEEQHRQISPEAYVKQNFKTGSEFTSSKSAETRSRDHARSEQDERDERVSHAVRQAYGKSSPDAWVPGAKSPSAKDQLLRVKNLQPGDWAYDIDEESFATPAKLMKAILTRLSAAERMQVASACTSLAAVGESTHLNLTYQEQCEGGKQVLLEDTVARQRITALEKRVANLEKVKVTPESKGKVEKPKKIDVKAKPKQSSTPVDKEAPKPSKPKVVQCLVCESKFVSNTQRNRHAWFAHGPTAIKAARQQLARAASLEKESARVEASPPSQEKTTTAEEKPKDVGVKTDSFLGKISPKRSKSV